MDIFITLCCLVQSNFLPMTSSDDMPVFEFDMKPSKNNDVQYFNIPLLMITVTVKSSVFYLFAVSDYNLTNLCLLFIGTLLIYCFREILVT